MGHGGGRSATRIPVANKLGICTDRHKHHLRDRSPSTSCGLVGSRRSQRVCFRSSHVPRLRSPRNDDRFPLFPSGKNASPATRIATRPEESAKSSCFGNILAIHILLQPIPARFGLVFFCRKILGWSIHHRCVLLAGCEPFFFREQEQPK